jgi:inner membrane protein
MASAFGHAFSALAIGAGFNTKLTNWKFWILGMACSVLPDADVITFKFGIAYGSFWGHRGFSHSFFFAFIIGLLATAIFYRKRVSIKERILLFTYFFMCTASHSILDAMTNGGLGVAFFSPFENSRYFFPWRPIQVSPLSVDSFFGERGQRVILSELIWVGIPGLILIFSARLIRKLLSTPHK